MLLSFATLSSNKPIPKGYIGGDALYTIEHARPHQYAFTFLVRSEARAAPVKAQYPDAKFVYGTLDDVDIIEKAAGEADIVIRKYLKAIPQAIISKETL